MSIALIAGGAFVAGAVTALGGVVWLIMSAGAVGAVRPDDGGHPLGYRL